MFFLVDKNRKIIFGWSAKCGCSHIKIIYWFLQTDKIKNKIHTEKDRNSLPDDIENYTTLVFIRNPYERLVSGFLDKYKIDGQYRHKWKDHFLSFSNFIDRLVNKDWKAIDKHHFIPQTCELFNKKKIILSKHIKLYDIANIDYQYIEHLFNKKIPTCVIKRRMGHERKTNGNKIDNFVNSLHIDTYINYSIDIKYFYTEEIKERVFNFYINDFNFFKENKIDYKNTTF